MTTTVVKTAPAVVRMNTARRYFLFTAWLALFLILIGFARTYYAKIFFATPELPSLVHVHGIIMSLWFGVFLFQVMLVRKRRIDLHRSVGLFGTVLAVLVLIFGVVTAIAAVRRGFTPGPPPLVFLTVPFFDMMVFSILAGLGIVNRHRPDIHKRLMLLSSLSMLSAAIGRIPLEIVMTGGPLVFFGSLDLIILVCVAIDTIQHRRLHPAFLWGSLLIIVSHPLRLYVGGTEWWMQFAIWLVG